MQMRRLTRSTKALSRNLWAACGLHFAGYNFCRIQNTVRHASLESNLTNHISELSELIASGRGCDTIARMAIARSEKCGKPRNNTPPPYAAPHLPAGYPDSGVICGTKNCVNAPRIWLKEDDEAKYADGERIFTLPTFAAKGQVQ